MYVNDDEKILKTKFSVFLPITLNFFLLPLPINERVIENSVFSVDCCHRRDDADGLIPLNLKSKQFVKFRDFFHLRWEEKIRRQNRFA